MLPNDPAADSEVERVARILASGTDDEPDLYDPDEIMSDGEPRWRQHVRQAIGAIHAHRTMMLSK